MPISRLVSIYQYNLLASTDIAALMSILMSSYRNKPRDYYPTPHLRRRLRALTAALEAHWHHVENNPAEPYSAEWVQRIAQAHSLHQAISDTLCSLRWRKKRGGG